MLSHACFYKLYFMSYLISCIHFDGANGYKDGHLLVRSTNRIKQNYVYSWRTYASKTECAWACTAAAQCGSVSWGPGGQCLLSGFTMPYFNVDRFSNKWQNRKLEWVAGWVTMAKLVYPVVLYLREGLFSYEHAKSVCNKEGTRIAHPHELVQARIMGLNMCSCGWLSNGRAGFVLQKMFPTCRSWDYTPDVNYCFSGPHEVYCKVP